MKSGRPLLHSLSALVACFVWASCSGRNLHRDVRSDPGVMTRGWTMATAPADREAGDRGFEYSTPVQFENTIIYGSQGGGLVSLYPGLGKVRWRLPIPGGVLSELGIHRNTVQFGGADGFFYSVAADTGKVLWKYETKNSQVSRPTFSNGRVFFTTPDDTVYALDAGTGKWLWHYKRRTTTAATIHGASAPLIDNNEALVGMSDGFILALGVDDGALKWERRIHSGTKFTDVDASPILNSDTVYVPSYDGALYALKRADGSVIWRHDSGGSRRVLIEESRLYLPSSQGKVIALDRNSSRVIWEFELDKGVPTTLISTEQYLIFGSSYQYLYALDKQTGKPVYRWNAGDGSGFGGSPLLDAEKRSFYLLSTAGNLYQFHLRKEPRARDLYEFGSFYR